ncbi:hypothetical protein SMICM17S_04389 [Streptomyces microflavus]
MEPNSSPRGRRTARRGTPCRRTPASCSTTATGASTAVRRTDSPTAGSSRSSPSPRPSAPSAICCAPGWPSRLPARPPGVWIAPAGLYEETRHTLERLELAPYVDLFRGDHLGFAATRESVARWWDLDAVARPPPGLPGTARAGAPGVGVAGNRGGPPAAGRLPGLSAGPGLPGANSRTRTRGCRRSCCRRGGRAAARRRSSASCTRGCGTPGSGSCGGERGARRGPAQGKIRVPRG